jgi:hypothetical protein
VRALLYGDACFWAAHAATVQLCPALRVMWVYPLDLHCTTYGGPIWC